MKNRIPFYIIIFSLVIIVFGLFEGAIITSETFSSIAEKLYWSGVNVIFLLGLPVGVVTIIELTGNTKGNTK